MDEDVEVRGSMGGRPREDGVPVDEAVFRRALDAAAEVCLRVRGARGANAVVAGYDAEVDAYGVGV